MRRRIARAELDRTRGDVRSECGRGGRNVCALARFGCRSWVRCRRAIVAIDGRVRQGLVPCVSPLCTALSGFQDPGSTPAGSGRDRAVSDTDWFRHRPCVPSTGGTRDRSRGTGGCNGSALGGSKLAGSWWEESSAGREERAGASNDWRSDLRGQITQVAIVVAHRYRARPVSACACHGGWTDAAYQVATVCPRCTLHGTCAPTADGGTSHSWTVVHLVPCIVRREVRAYMLSVSPRQGSSAITGPERGVLVPLLH